MNNNPIAQAMFKSNNNNASKLSQIASIMNGDPNAAYQNMLRTNPKFAQFVKDNQGKSIEQIARENGIDPSILSLFK